MDYILVVTGKFGCDWQMYERTFRENPTPSSPWKRKAEINEILEYSEIHIDFEIFDLLETQNFNDFGKGGHRILMKIRLIKYRTS